MSLMKETGNGMLMISNRVVATIIDKVIKENNLEKIIWPANPNSTIVNILNMVTDADKNSSFRLRYVKNDDGVQEIRLALSIIIVFGCSIKKYTSILADALYNEIFDCVGEGPAVIVINIEGVRSKQVAPRKTKVVYRYENKR